jgi:hypothetical protein
MLKMRYLNIIVVALLMMLSSCTPPADFRDNPDKFQGLEKNIFFADPLVFYELDSLNPRLDLNVEIPVENISFQKDYADLTYHSKINVTVNLKSSSGESVISKTYEETSSYNYKEIKEKSKESQYYFYNYNIKPGNYKLDVVVKDVYANNEFKKSFDIAVKDFKSGDVTISDLMMLSKIDVNPDGTKDITPLISNNILGLKELFAFFEIYNNTNAEISKEYAIKLKDNKESVVKEYTVNYVLSPGKNQEFESLFILKELKNYLPNEPQYDYYQNESKPDLYFKLEILDKSSNLVVAQKKLSLFPERLRPRMVNRPPPHR